MSFPSAHQHARQWEQTAGHGGGRSPTLLGLWETSLTSLSLLNCKPTDPRTPRAYCTCLRGLWGGGLHSGPWQRPREAWAALQLPGPQTRPGGAAWRGAPRGRARTAGYTVTQALRSAAVGARQASLEPRTPGCDHTPSPRHSPPGTARGARQAWGSATWRQRARSEAGRRTPEQMDRLTDGRTDTQESQPASHTRTTTITKE